MTANPCTADPGDRLAGEARYRRFLDALLVGDVAYCRAEVQAWLDTGRIIEAHGGWIDVDSAPDRGACFTFSVPARRADAAEVQA